MRISIVLCTYNGEKYIIEQLKSLLEQNYKADEIIIVDDNSLDLTVEIVEKFIKNNNLNNWYFYRNNINKGYFKNFIEATLLATGDYIFLCDQDDIWEKNKVKEFVKVLNSNKKISALTSRIKILKKNRFQIGGHTINNKFLSYKTLKKINHNSLLLNPKLLGCTMCYRNENNQFKIVLMNLLNKIENNFNSHDTLFNLIALLLGDIYMLNKRLVNYRVHNNNSSFSNKVIFNRNHQININISILESVKELFIFKPKVYFIIKNITKYLKLRIIFLSEFNFYLFLKLFFKFKYYVYYSNSFSLGFHMLISDFYISIFGDFS